MSESVIAAVPKQLYIAGRWRDASDGSTLSVEDPSTGRELARVADATIEDGKAALDAAVAVQAEWARSAPRDRGEILRRAFELVTQRSGELAQIMPATSQPSRCRSGGPDGGNSAWSKTALVRNGTTEVSTAAATTAAATNVNCER